MDPKEKFKKEPGTGGIKGQELEYKYATLMYLRCLNPEYGVSSFRLAANFVALDKKESVGRNLQDIGLQIYRDHNIFGGSACSSTNTSSINQQIFFMQLKHKETAGLSLLKLKEDSKNNPFSLPRYYQWFQKLQQKLVTSQRLETKKDVFPGERFGDIIPTIFTTADTRGDLDEEAVTWHTDQLLNTQPTHPNHYFTLNITNNILQCLPGEDHASKYHFLNKLRIYPEQAHEKILTDLIKKELQAVYNMTLSEANAFYFHFLDQISKWWKMEGNSWFLTQRNKYELLEMCRSPNVVWSLQEQTTRMLDEIKNCDIHFEVDDDVVEQLCTCQVLNINTNTGTTKLATFRLVQMLQDIGQADNFLVTMMSTVARELEILTKAWNATGCSYLIIVCDQSLPTDEDCFPYLLPLLFKDGLYDQPSLKCGDTEQKIVFIDLPEKDFDVLKQLNETSLVFGEGILSVNLSALNQKSQDRILNREVNVIRDEETKAVKLRDLKAADVCKIKDHMNVEVLWMFVQNIIVDVVARGCGDEIDLSRLYAKVAEDPQQDIREVVKAMTDLGRVLKKRIDHEVKIVETFVHSPSASVDDVIPLILDIPRRLGGFQTDESLKKLSDQLKSSSVIEMRTTLLDKWIKNVKKT